MKKPDAISQAMWDRLNDEDKAFIVQHEKMHDRVMQAAMFGFKPNEVLEGTSSDAAAYHRNSWMF